MRRMLSFLLLATAAASPLSAQSWNQGDARPERGDRGRDGQAQRDYRDADRPDARGPLNDDLRDNGRYGRDNGRTGRDYGRSGAPGDGRYDGRDYGRNDGRNDGRGNDWRDRDGRGRDGRNYSGRDDRGGWNSGWRNDRRYDWQGYRSSNRALYRTPRYYGPRGSAYSRWSRGYRVQPYFYGQSYWISDPYRYRLPPAYGNYRWVRYYDDVALIDIRSGLIEDIIYSFFWR